MINYKEGKIKQVSVHYIGHQAEQEGFRLSQSPVDIDTDELKQFLLKYFLANFRNPQFYAFEMLFDDGQANQMYNWCTKIFEDETCTHDMSQLIAGHLYENSVHPAIKSGELMVALIKDVLVDDELVDAIGIFKSEHKDSFLKLKQQSQTYKLDLHQGIAINKLDKACLILNTEKAQGYKMCIIDNSNRNSEAVFWRNDFLKVTYREDDYHNTTVYIQATKDFIDEKLKPEFKLDKKDEATILSASKDYFNTAESFNEDNYLDSIFEDNTSLKNEFNDFKRERKLDFSSNFDISEPAVKKYNGIFRSILKLDKNFTVYIHGNRNRIEKGEDDKGKYYKMYYEEEK